MKNKTLFLTGIVLSLFALATVSAFSLNSTISKTNANKLGGNTFSCIQYDTYQDGIITNGDALLIKSKYGQKNCSNENTWCSKMDVLHDGIVDKKDYDAVRKNLGNCVRRLGVKGRGFFLRGFKNFAKHFAGRGLVEFGLWTCVPNGL